MQNTSVAKRGVGRQNCGGFAASAEGDGTVPCQLPQGGAPVSLATSTPVRLHRRKIVNDNREYESLCTKGVSLDANEQLARV